MKIMLFDKITSTLLGLKCTEDESSPDLIFVRSTKLHNHALVPDSVSGIFRAGSGIDNIPVEEMTKRGIPVFNAPGANANSVKELVLGMMIMSARNCFPAFEFVQKSGSDTNFEKSKSRFCGTEIAGKNILIIGLGNIGYSLAEACHNLGMNVFSYSHHTKKGIGWLNQLESLNSPAVTDCDFISIHTPDNKETVGLINRDLISNLKNGVILLNFAREKLVDTDSLCEALDSGKIRFYACDFVQEKLKKYDSSRVVMLPHLGASASEANIRAIQMVAEQAENYWRYGDIVNSVNFPNIITDHKINYGRLLIVALNILEVMPKIATTIHESGLSISTISSKNDITYLTVDIDDPSTYSNLTGLLKKLECLDGVLKTRIIQPPKS